jgi:hypothetical protein
MRILLYPLGVMAAAGFLLSLAAHLLAITGTEVPGGGKVWALHLGIFVVWLPVVLISRRKPQRGQCKDHWKAVMSACPVWMSRGLKLLFAYALVNFMLFFVGTIGQPKPHGAAPPAVIRGFSGHWMVFYGAAFITFYSAIKAAHGERRGSARKSQSELGRLSG